jgi:hypothetical protein
VDESLVRKLVSEYLILTAQAEIVAGRHAEDHLATGTPVFLTGVTSNDSTTSAVEVRRQASPATASS